MCRHSLWILLSLITESTQQKRGQGEVGKSSGDLQMLLHTTVLKQLKKKKICAIVTPSMTVFILFPILLPIPISTFQFLLFNVVLFLTWETFFHKLKIPVQLVLKNIYRVHIKCNRNKETSMKTQIFLDLSPAFESAARNSFGITAGLWLVSSDSTEYMWSSHKLLRPALLSPGAGYFSPGSLHVYGLCC